MVRLGSWTVLCGVLGLVRGQELQEGLKQFTDNLLQNLESSNEANFVVSPYSIHSVFSGLLVGAKGQTRRELEQMLGVDGGQNTINGYSAVTSGLRQGKTKVNVANLMALAKGFKPKVSFSQTLFDAFEAGTREYNFGNALESTGKINRFVSDKTAGKITELIKPEELEPLTRMILVNAVYFKGTWQYQFNPDDTFTTKFNSPIAGQVDTPFMTLETNLKMLEDSDSKLDILELPYGDGLKSMIFVLPKHNSPTSDLTTRLAGVDLNRLRSLPEQPTLVSVPRFKMKFQTQLKDKIEALGAPTVWTFNADLS